MNTYNVKKLAERWGCSKFTIYNIIEKGELAFFKISESYRFRLSDVEDYERRKYQCVLLNTGENGAPMSRKVSESHYVPPTVQ